MTAYTIVLVLIFVAAAASFVTLLFLQAPYGRFMRGGWGVALPARWGWVIMELPAAISILVMFLVGPSRDPLPILFLALWEIHYLYRSLLYPLLMPGGTTKNMPVAVMLMAVAYNCANGYVNGYHLFFRADVYTSAWLADPRFLAGMVLFAGGFVVHATSDSILRRLRSDGSQQYRIPRGGLFRYVSCPNYLGEIVQWCGFALATWSLAGLSFAVFTVANLLPRALAYHRWYRETFPDYPPERRALIPALL